MIKYIYHLSLTESLQEKGNPFRLSLLVVFSIYQISKLVGDSDRPKRGQTSVNLE